MGLDMYLSKKTYVKQWSHRKPEDQFEVIVKKGGVTYPNIKTERISYVTEELMYWRKANQIHGWFVNNATELEQEVRYYVSKENLEELLLTCKNVLTILENSNKIIKQIVGGWKDGEEYKVDVETYDCVDEINDLLPPTQGFFYGSDTIDEWYKQDVENTIKFLEEELPNTFEDDEFEYYASW